MLALSTSFTAGQFSDDQTLLTTLEGFNITGIELEYRIRAEHFQQMKKRLTRSRLNVVSVHNNFPIPATIKAGQNTSAWFSLSDTDREARLDAVKWTLGTIEQANDLEAGVVILNCGQVESVPAIERLHGFYRAGQIESKQAQAFITQAMKVRDEKKTKHIDALLFSLDRLVRISERYQVTLALKNQYHYFELPGTDDFSILFNEMDGAPVGYWHDTGHAQVNEILSFGPAADLLDRHHKRLVGIHLHDTKGLDDHLPPGSGDIDFSKILPHLKPDTVKVIALKADATDAEVTAGIEYINHILNTADDDKDISDPFSQSSDHLVLP